MNLSEILNDLTREFDKKLRSSFVRFLCYRLFQKLIRNSFFNLFNLYLFKAEEIKIARNLFHDEQSIDFR